MMRTLLALMVALFPTFSAAQALDYDIGNQTFPAFRADLNNHLSAIVQQNAGTTAPAVTFPYMIWADTSGAAPIIRYRNAANSGWAAAFRIDPSATMWLGGLTTGAATITGGSINGTTIGGTTPAAVTATSITASSARLAANEFPALDLDATGAAAGFRRVRILRNFNTFSAVITDSAGAFVQTLWDVGLNAAGATFHSLRIGAAERLRVENFTTRVTVDGSSSTGFFVDGGSTVGGAGGFEWVLSSENTGSIPEGVLQPRSLGNVLGRQSRRWGNIYLASGPNVSSDARLKHDIDTVAEPECRAADRIELRRYRLNDGDGRWHFGAIAQEVIAAFEAEGLDWRDYALVTGSEETSYGVVYDELQSLKLACM